MLRRLGPPPSSLRPLRGTAASNRARPFTLSAPVASSSPRDSSRYYLAIAQERFHDDRYEAVRQIGSGRYSHVWVARDLCKDSLVALKLLTSDCYGTSHDIFELEILEAIARQQTKLSAGCMSNVIHVTDTFTLQGHAGPHQCIVMPVLGCDLDDQARRFPRGRIPVKIMKAITRQLLTGLAFLHDQCGVIHTDLHPSNICFEIGMIDSQRMAAGESAIEVTSALTEQNAGSIQILDFGVASSSLKGT